MAASTTRMRVDKIGGEVAGPLVDVLAVEEPLEIRIAWRENGIACEQPIAITMRTPDHDVELAIGFLCSEGVLFAPEHVLRCTEGKNVVRVELAPGRRVDLGSLERHVYVSSSCGVCGKSSIDAVRTRGAFGPPDGDLRLEASVIHALPDRLRLAQSIFDETGGLHAAALFDPAGGLRCIREDVGRHNAVDKLVGAAVRAGELPLRERVLVLSGRASFELVQKAAMAGIPAVIAVGAPSSLAVDFAREARMTLLGFVRNRRFNVYAGADRVAGVSHG